MWYQRHRPLFIMFPHTLSAKSGHETCSGVTCYKLTFHIQYFYSDYHNCKLSRMNLLQSFVGREDTDWGEGGADELATEFLMMRRHMTSCSATDGREVLDKI